MGNKRAIVRFTIEEYNQWAHNVFATIEKSKLQATLVVNESLLTLYFLLGKEIVERQEVLGWGAQVVNLLSADLLRRYPKESGFSERNLKYMRQFAKEYPHFPFLQVPLAQLETNPIAWKSALNNSTDKKGFVQVPLAQITWYHHISLISRVKETEKRAFYITKTAENGWSRDIMLLQIDNNLHENYGKALNNFNQTLPEYQSDLARDIFKDPYKFGFLNIREKVDERTIENKLIQKVTDFLLEMGKGFAFVGHQYHIEVEEDDYYLDILMYHLKLHCYVVIELKAVEFMPEFISKLNFYISAVDDQVKTKEDNPTIGLLLCTNKKSKKVEYSLRGNQQPLGVASYHLSNALQEALQSALPTADEIRKKLEELQNESFD